jgi:hypothetical protein
MINFVSRDEKKAASLIRLKRVVIAWTSLVLGVYIVAIAGLVGWNTLWSSKERKASTEEETLRAQIRQYSDNEVLAVRLIDRASEINNYITTRKDITNISSLLLKEGYEIFKWEYALDGIQRVTVIASDSAALKAYENHVGNFYEQVQVEKIFYDRELGWVGALLLKNKKKA